MTIRTHRLLTMADVGYLTLSCLLLLCTAAAREYDLSLKKDCKLSSYNEVPSGGSVKLTTTPDVDAPQRCVLNLRAQHENDYLKITFNKQNMGNCNIEVQLKQVLKKNPDLLHKIDCNSEPKGTIDLKERAIRVTIVRSALNAKKYNIQMTVSAYRKVAGAPGPTDGDDESVMTTGMIVGVVTGVLVLLAVIAVILVCCCRKKQLKARDDSHSMIKQNELNNKQGLNNAVMKNGNSPMVSVGTNDGKIDSKMSAFDLPSSPRSGALLSDFSDKKFVYDVNKGGRERGPQNGHMDRSRMNERSVDAPSTERNNQRLIQEDLRRDPRFRETFTDSEYESDQRGTTRKYRDGDGMGSVAPPLPMAPKSPGVGRRSNHAGIRRAPRPTSSTEEIEQLDLPLNRRGDANIKLIPESPNERGSLGDVVPIRLGTARVGDWGRSGSYSEQDEIAENMPTELSYEDEHPGEKPRHTLRPNRGHGGKDGGGAGAAKSKPSQSDAVTKTDAKKKSSGDNRKGRGKADKAGDRRDLDVNHSGRSADGGYAKERSKSTDARESGRGTKNKGQKSPKLGSLGRRRGGSLGRDLDDYPNSRPDSPGSMYSNAPLQRSSSKQSLYASRSSLYNRRRRGSYSESVATYAQDDASLYQRSNRGSRRYPDDGESRFHRDRSYRSSRSMGDVRGSRRDYDDESNFRRNRSNRSSRSYGDMQDTGTQTLHETATQTGAGFLNKGRRSSGRKSPKTRRNTTTTVPQNSKGAGTKASMEKAQTVDSGVGTDDQRRKTTPKVADTRSDDSDESVTTMKQRMALELNAVLKKPIPLKKNARQHPFSEDHAPAGLPSYEDSQSAGAVEPTGYQAPGYEENVYDDHFNYGQQQNNPSQGHTGQGQGYNDHDQGYNSQGQGYNGQGHVGQGQGYDGQGQGYDGQGQAYPQEEQIYQNFPVEQPSPNPHKSPAAKSPWAVLCELTDSDYKSHSSIHSGVKGHQPDYAKSEASYKGGDRGKAGSVASYRGQPDETNMRPGYPQKSSWEQLQQMADPGHSQGYRSYYDPAESNV